MLTAGLRYDAKHFDGSADARKKVSSSNPCMEEVREISLFRFR